MPAILLIVLDISWMPRIFALTSPRARSAVLSRSRDAVYLLLLPTVIGISVGAPLVLAVWVPPRYHPYGLLVVVAALSVSSVPLAGVQAATRVLLLAGTTRPIASRTLLAAGISVALSAVLVPVLKIDGAALAALFGFVLVHLLLARAAHAAEPLARPPWRLVAQLVGAVVIAGISTQLPAGAPFTVMRACVTLACLCMLVALMCELIAPGRFARMSRLARRIHVDAPPT
jgi:O-antigen/teichoic acid export membrane protein